MNAPYPPAPQDEERSTDTTVAVAALYRDHARGLVSSVRKAFGAGPPDPEDVAQQAFQQLIERGDLSSIHNLKAFLWRIARNIVLGDKRSDQIRTKYDYEVEQLYFALGHDEITPERITMAKEQLSRVAEALRAMPEKRRRAVILHRVDGLSVTEVGHQLGISRQNASKHLVNGLADLNVMFLQDGEDRTA
ncbi:MAG: sigma-70 family RNA polymerase sigma factor [Pseudomonadota bacterium]